MSIFLFHLRKACKVLQDFFIICQAFYFESNITTFMETLHTTSIVVVAVVVVVVVYGMHRASIVAGVFDSCISYQLFSPV